MEAWKVVVLIHPNKNLSLCSRVSDWRALQKSTIYIVNKVAKLSISKDIASKCVDCVAISSGHSSILGVLLIEADRFVLGPLYEVLMSGLWENRSYWHCIRGLVSVGLVFPDATIYLCIWVVAGHRKQIRVGLRPFFSSILACNVMSQDAKSVDK